MNGEEYKHIVDVENKFLELSKTCSPNVFDNGLFIEAVLDVTAVLKENRKEYAKDSISDKMLLANELSVIDNLYKSLKDFEHLYYNCLKKDK